MLIRGLMALIILLASGLVLVIVGKIVWINLTPGQYVKYGCCGYGYLTEEQFQAERKKINICPGIECDIEQGLGYKSHTLFNRIDLNK